MEAMNRDSCTKLAASYNEACFKGGKRGNFVLISAGSTAPLLEKYIQTKREAETYLIDECNEFDSYILRPGMVWHHSERPVTLPLKAAVDFGNCLGKQLGIPTVDKSTSLRVLTEFAIKGAKGELTQQIWTSEMMDSLSK